MTIGVSATIAFLLGAILFSLFNPDKSIIAEQISDRKAERWSLRDIIGGDWDIACPISETTQPRLLLSEIGFDEFEFSEDGNGDRNIILDGETGIILINKNKKMYSLFLVFDNDRITIVPQANSSGVTECYVFFGATLNRSSVSADDWLYLTVGGKKI